MKIKLTEDMKRVITLSEMDAVKETQTAFADLKNLNWEAEHLLHLAAGTMAVDVIKTEAQIARNGRIWNYYGDSGRIDVYVTVYGFSAADGFFIASGYVSDIWQLDSKNAEEIKRRFFIKHYTEA